MVRSATYWDEEASRVADFVFTNMYEAHRGAMLSEEPGVAVVFGNDGYETPRVKAEMARVCTTLRDQGVEILGLMPNKSQYSWALLVRSEDVVALNQLVWTAWLGDLESLEGFEGQFYAVQSDIARRVIARHGMTPIA